MSQLNFEFVRFTKLENGMHRLSDEQKKELGKLFCNLTDGNLMFILNPNDVLSNEVLDKYREEGYDFNFSHVNLPKAPLSEKHKNYYWYLTQKHAYSDTYDNLRHSVQFARENRHIDDPSFCYFIVEEDQDHNHIVRGIARGTKKGFSFYINPEHRERVENKNNDNVYDWSLKFSDEYETKDSLEKYQTKIDDYLNTTTHLFTDTNPNSGREGK